MTTEYLTVVVAVSQQATCDGAIVLNPITPPVRNKSRRVDVYHEVVGMPIKLSVPKAEYVL